MHLYIYEALCHIYTSVHLHTAYTDIDAELMHTKAMLWRGDARTEDSLLGTPGTCF